MPQRNNLPLPDDGGARRHGSRLRVWRDHPEVEPAAERRLEVPRDGGRSLLDLARRAAKQAGDVLARRGRQDEDDAKRFVDVRGLGLVKSVGAGGEVLDHVVEVDARLVGQEVHALGDGASRGSRAVDPSRNLVLVWRTQRQDLMRSYKDLMMGRT